MFSASEKFYDLIYASLKNYSVEAEQIAALIRRAHPNAREILDVACGTAEHARMLTEKHGFSVDGIDLNPAFVRIAQEKLPKSRIHVADMSTFELTKRYDAILCLFSSIAYMRTVVDVQRALECFRAHLREDGIVLVEPWFAPGGLVPNRIVVRTAETEGLTVCRMSHITVEGRLSRSQFHYLVGRSSGIEQISECHELGLFTVEEMLQCFNRAGLSAEFDPKGPYGRGLYLARLP